MSDAVVSGTFVRIQTMADGTPRIIIDLDCGLSDIANFNLVPGATFALARITDGAAREDMVRKSSQSANQAEYSEHARVLRVTGFFRNPKVWPVVGSDKGFRDWLEQQKCCACGAPPRPDPADLNRGPRNEAAHVRSVKNGAGTSIKPEYSAITLCHDCHQRQHSGGYGEILTVPGDLSSIRDYLDRMVVSSLEGWGWQTVKKTLGYKHWNEVPPDVLCQWADKHDLVQCLPSIYKEAS